VVSWKGRATQVRGAAYQSIVAPRRELPSKRLEARWTMSEAVPPGSVRVSGSTIFDLRGGNQLFLYQVGLASLDGNDFVLAP
jgi:hypothetical protein